MTIWQVEDISIEGPAWLSQPCVLGVDEAGRGPVLGPMVYACAIAPLARTEALKSQGFADSKQLTAERRDQLYREMDDDGALLCLVDAISAAHISGKMQGRHKVSLNQIAMDSTVNLIKAALAQGANLQEVYVDTVGDSQTYQAKLSAQFPGVQFTVCPKADALYPIVSAASIAAKVARDQGVVDLAGGDKSLGSGYPSDPITKAWLEQSVTRVFGWQSFVRFSWATCTGLLEKNCTAVAWQTEEERPANQPSLHGMLKGSKTRKRHTFFTTRSLVRASEW